MKNPIAVNTTEKTTLLMEVHKRLSQVYGRNIKYFHDINIDPLSELVSAFLLHRTRNSASGQAFKNLKALFGTGRPYAMRL